MFRADLLYDAAGLAILAGFRFTGRPPSLPLAIEARRFGDAATAPSW